MALPLRACDDSPLTDHYSRSFHSHLNPASFHRRGIETHRQELLDHFDVRLRMTGEAGRAEAAAPGEGERDQELVGEMLANRCARGEIMPDAIDDRIGDLLGAHAAFAKTGEGLDEMLRSDLDRENKTRPATRRVLDN